MRNLFTLLFLLLTITATCFAQQKERTDSIYSIQNTVLIPTKSGINISAIIARRKTNKQPSPVILFYTTYYQGAGDAIIAKRAGDRNYIGVVAYARGIRTDLKNYAPYENEHSDIYDIIDWISKQEWCNGKVGMYGGSYTGFSQWATAKKIQNFAANIRGYEIDSVAKVSMRTLAFEWMDWILKDAPKQELLKDNRECMNNYFHTALIIDSLDDSNGVVFSTDAFDKDFIIIGAFTGRLITSINKRDMDVSISFYEQSEDRKYFMLSPNVGRASYARDNTRRQLLTPGKTEEIRLNASYILSKKISKGSKLVIVVNVNKHPFEIISYGSGKEPKDETIKDAGEPLEIKWFNDSYVEIPVWQN